MSADDPTDDELEREARGDVPLPMGGTMRHAPKLETRSRAINPRQLLQAEAEAQSRDAFSMNPITDAQARQQRGIISPEMGRALLGQPLRSGKSIGTGLPQSVAGRLALVQELLEPPSEEDAPPANEHAAAWDRYVSSALVAAATLRLGDIETVAVQVADRLLEERRKRFG